MTMRSISFAVAVASAFAATSAVAGSIAEPVVEQPVIIPAADPAPVSDWTGPYVGLQLGTGSVESSGVDDVDINTMGVQAGYLYDMGALVLGGELDYANVDFDDDFGVDADGDVTRLKLRAGYDAGRLLPYLTAGVASMDIEANGFEASDQGSVYGLGLDFKATENVLVGAEYLRHDFSDFDDTGVDFEADTLSIRASYQF